MSTEATITRIGVRASASKMTVKHCGQCGRDLDATTANFYASSRNPDGSPRTLKSWCIPCSNRSSKESHERRRNADGLAPVDREPNVRLPIEPFRLWLMGRFERLERQRRGGSEDALAALALEIGVHPRACYRWLRETRSIGIDQVDRALVNSGTAQLWELYPSLYEHDGAAAA